MDRARIVCALFHQQSYEMTKLRTSSVVICLLFLVVYLGTKQITNNKTQLNLERLVENIRPGHLFLPGLARSSPERTNLLLITFFRGGSTFLGEIFNRNPNVFYCFEPLKTLENDYIRLSQNGTDMKNLPTQEEAQVTALKNLYDCNFSADDPYWIHYFVTYWEESVKIVPYKKCLLEVSGNDPRKFTPDNVRKCLPIVENACRNSTIRVIKTIRMRPHQTPSVVQAVPDISFVYYTRDPRGSIVSISEIETDNTFADSWVQSVSKRRCSRMHGDWQWLQRRENTNISLINERYEQLATAPFTTAADIYSQLSLELPEEVTGWLRGNTAAPEDGYGFNTTRKNSTETAFQWRQKLPVDALSIINQNCQQVLEEFNYAV